jgi:hypothetical protein
MKLLKTETRKERDNSFHYKVTFMDKTEMDLKDCNVAKIKGEGMEFQDNWTEIKTETFEVRYLLFWKTEKVIKKKIEFLRTRIWIPTQNILYILRVENP